MATERDAKVQGFKRINFFKGFLTTEHDWNDAERYHLEKRKLHNRLCHAPGIIPGYSGELKVTNLPFLLKPLAGVAERIIYSNAEDLLNEEAKVFGEFLKTRGKPAA